MHYTYQYLKGYVKNTQFWHFMWICKNKQYISTENCSEAVQIFSHIFQLHKQKQTLADNFRPNSFICILFIFRHLAYVLCRDSYGICRYVLSVFNQIQRTELGEGYFDLITQFYKLQLRCNFVILDRTRFGFNSCPFQPHLSNRVGTLDS